MSDVHEIGVRLGDLSVDDDFGVDIDEDFVPEPLHALVARRVARNEPRSEIARALGLTVDEVAALVGVAIAERRAERGTVSEQLFALHVALDDLVDDILPALERQASRYDWPALMEVAIEAARLRIDLFAAQRAEDSR